MAMNKAPEPDAIKIHQLISVLYSKCRIKDVINSHANGDAIRTAIITSLIKSPARREVILATLAPRTFRMPISFVRFSAMYIARPNKPIHEMKMMINVKVFIRDATSFDCLNLEAYSVSANWYSVKKFGLYLFNIFSTFSKFSSEG